MLRRSFIVSRIATLRKCIAFVVTFGFLAITFMVLAAAHFTGNPEYVELCASSFFVFFG